MIRAATISLCFVVAACHEPPSPNEPARASLYVPPVVRPPDAERTESATLGAPPTRTTSATAAAALRRVAFVVRPTFREGALSVLSAAQLDALDRIFLGRLDLHAFAGEGSTAFVWLAGDVVRGADVALKDGRRVRVGHYPGSQSSAAGWYDQDGLSLASEILGRPVALSRVTSKFGERLHPITGAQKQHRGVDYGAPEGTAIFAVGDGTILTLATDSSAGNHVKLSHPSGFESWYLHLHHFAPGLAKGSSVRQGDVIGYVGTTGASTGPHLHYELHRNGLALDPQRQISLPLVALGPLSQPEHRKNLEALP